MEGQLVLYVQCLVCRRVGEIPQAKLDPDVLPKAGPLTGPEIVRQVVGEAHGIAYNASNLPRRPKALNKG